MACGGSCTPTVEKYEINTPLQASTLVKNVGASMVVTTTKKMKLHGFCSCDIIAVVRERKKKY